MAVSLFTSLKTPVFKVFLGVLSYLIVFKMHYLTPFPKLNNI